MSNDEVKVKIPATALGIELVSFAAIVQHVVDTNQAFNATGPGIRLGQRILDRILGKSVGDEASVARADLKALSDAFDAPAAGISPSLTRTHDENGVQLAAPQELRIPGRAFIPYLDAIAEALDPSVKTDEKAA